MTDYEWAMEYKKSADVVKIKIENTEKQLPSFDKEKKLRVLYEMYNDCLYSYKCLMRRCKYGRNKKEN